MPAFELSLLLRILPRHEVSSALKRVGTLLLDKGVVLQKLENHGTKDLPYRMSKENQMHHKGSYFVYTFMGSPKIFDEVQEICSRDVDILRHDFMYVPKPISSDCTLEEEMLPPAYRKSVQAILKKSDKRKAQSKPHYKHLREHNFFDIYM